MKKTLLAFGVAAAAIGCTLALTANSRGLSPSAHVASETSQTEETTPSVGTSIGTVAGQPYAESGLNLNYFNNIDYVAQTSENTYMGFDINEAYNYDEGNPEGEPSVVRYMSLKAISSTEESVTIPDNVLVDGTEIPVMAISGERDLQYGFTDNIKNLTIPATVVDIYAYYNFERYLQTVYMLGAAPDWNSGSERAPQIYVCNREDLSSYLNSNAYQGKQIKPFGWDYEWVTVNVEKNGEFAETYLTQNNHDWSAAQYLKVTGNINDIDLGAIKNLTSLVKLDLSETSITSLPERFMYNRASLSEVKLPSTLTAIGNSAFYGCRSLTGFDLNGITYIGNNVFQGCSALAYINLTGVKTIGNNAFYECSTLDNIDLSTVETLGESAFSYCGQLRSVNPVAATTIPRHAFYNCGNLKEVTFGDNLQLINSSAFASTAVESVTLPEGVAYLQDEAFNNCTSLTTVELPSTLQTIGYSAFSGCTALASVTMKTGLTAIGESAFYGCSSLESITIPATVNLISQRAFAATGIKEFKCYAVVPPMTSGSFIGEGMDMTRTYLYVPPFSKDFYRNTQPWSDFYLMRSIQDQIDYILVDRPLTINLEEEDNAVVANNPAIELTWNRNEYSYDYNYNIGQLTATGEGTLSAGQLTINAQLSHRMTDYGSTQQNCPTLINYADKMRADNVSHKISFKNDYSSSGEWHFISLPYDVKVADITPGNDTYWVIRRYDSAARAAGDTEATWVDLTPDDTMEAGKGYIVSTTGGETYRDQWGDERRRDPELTFTSGNSLTKNNIFRSTDVIVPLTEYTAEFAHNRSWNLVGNPYPCYFDMHFLNEEFTAPITIWNSYSYVAYSPVDDDLVLSPYEAFFVQCPLDATEMTFKEAGRLHSDAGAPAYKVAARNTAPVAAEGRNVFDFNISDGAMTDRARIVLNPQAKAGYEIGRDASKFFADNNACAQFYVSADVNYSIDERPVGDGTATLGLRAAKEGVYTLSLSGRHSADWQVVITDNLTGQSTDLAKEDYTFTATCGDTSNRFTVRFILADPAGIDQVVSGMDADTQVTVSSISGVVMFTGRVADMQLPAGIYLITAGNETRKAIIK